MTEGRKVRLKLWGLWFPAFLVIAPFLAIFMVWLIWSEITQDQLLWARRLDDEREREEGGGE